MKMTVCSILLNVLYAAIGNAAPLPHLVAHDRGGMEPGAPHLWEGSNYTFSEQELPGTPTLPPGAPVRAVAFGERVTFVYTGLTSGAHYRIRATFLSENHGRVQQVRMGETVIEDALALPDGQVLEKEWAVPAEACAGSELNVVIERVSGPNAVVSGLEIYSDHPHRLGVKPQPGSETPRWSPLPKSVAGVRQPIISLNGMWQFHSSPPNGFQATESGDGWSPIEVPGEWEMQGFQVEATTAAGYRRAFELPADWRGKRMRLRFDAVYSECTVWVNGRKVGGHLGGFTPFELDVTDAVQAGGNTLALAVKNDSLADSLASGSQYAAHTLGGISRKVTLFALPDVQIASLHVATDLDSEYRDAVLNLEIAVSNEGGDMGDVSCEVAVVDGGGDTIKTAEYAIPALPAGSTTLDVHQLAIDAPLLWNSEHPNLYRLRVRLTQNGNLLQTVERRFGFREVEVRGNQLLVNGQSVQLRGVCRHEVHPLRGRSLEEGQWRKDVERFRSGNVNHIRTSHYPPAEELMDAADELGMFIEAEGPFCWAHNAKAPSPAIREATVRQLLELVQRDRSHPSVIVWSLANESQWNNHFAAASRAIRALDPSRPQTFNFFPWGGAPSKPDQDLCEIASDHYPGPGGPEKYAQHSRPVNYGEYCHLNAYNRFELVTDPGVRDAWGVGLATMWENMRKSPGTVGGSLWAGIDDSFYLPEGDWVGYGTWGPIDGWRRPKPEYWHMKKAYSPVRVTARRVPMPESGKSIRIPVENRHHFTNLKELTIEGWLEKPGHKVHRITTDVPPDTAGYLEIAGLKGIEPGNVRLHLRFTSPLGFVIDEYSLPVGEPPPETPEASSSGNTTLEEREDVFVVRAGDAVWRVSKSTGSLGTDGGLLGGPSLMLLPLNGEGGTQMTRGEQAFDPFTRTATGWQCGEVQATTTGELVRITVNGRYREAEGMYLLDFGGDGRVSIHYDFVCVTDVNPRQVGLVFDVPGTWDRLTWNRDGQWTFYPDDHIGRTHGTARAFAGMNTTGPAGPAIEPDWPYARDGNDLGCNDFRSTKANIRTASLTSPDGAGLRVHRAEGAQHVRTWVDGERIRMLVADYNNPGAERFFRGHAAPHDRPLKKGDSIRGRTVIEMMR